MTGYRKSYPSRTFYIFDMPQHSTTCELKDDVPKRNLLDTVYIRSQAESTRRLAGVATYGRSIEVGTFVRSSRRPIQSFMRVA